LNVHTIEMVDDVEVEAGGLATASFLATDLDGGPLAVAVDGLADWMRYDASSATLTLEPGSADDGDYPLTARSVGAGEPAYAEFTVRVSGGGEPTPGCGCSGGQPMGLWPLALLGMFGMCRRRLRSLRGL